MILTSAGQLPHKPSRIISLVPSQTELLHYLGLEDETIAITKFCVHPEAWFRNKTRIGGTKAIDIEKIRTLNPDLIIANKEENVKEQVEMLAEDFPVCVTDVNNLTDAYRVINDIGILTNRQKAASELVDIINMRFDPLIQTANTKNRIPVAYLIWKDPYMTIGGDTFISSMLETVGLRNIFADQTRYPEITVAQLKTRNCELILLSSEPYPFKQKHINELQKELPGTRIILADGEMFSWYGSRLLLAPDYFMTLMSELKLS
ncbi:MAG: helical backbone metal receptor [Ferruginibacter sp.]